MFSVNLKVNNFLHIITTIINLKRIWTRNQHSKSTQVIAIRTVYHFVEQDHHHFNRTGNYDAIYHNMWML